MRDDLRMIRYDESLHLEACRFQGMAQPFPNHFHDYYVLGLIEAGSRRLFCKNRDYIIGPETILLFQPGESHGCAQSGKEPLDYRSLHIPEETMRDLTEEITGARTLPGFSDCVLRCGEAAGYLRSVHEMAMEESREFEKEEALLLLVSLLLERFGKGGAVREPERLEGVGTVCAYMDAHFCERLTLEQLCQVGGCSKSSLLRAFAKEKGVTPYRYLQAVRVGRAKEMLERGVPPAEAALRAGFADQSHFTRFFTQFIGLPPAAYGRAYREAAI